MGPGKLYSGKHISEELGVSERTVTRLNLPFYRVGRCRRYLGADVLRYLATVRSEPVSHAKRPTKTPSGTYKPATRRGNPGADFVASIRKKIAENSTPS